MRKIALVIWCVCCFGFLYGQTEVGIKGGINLAQLDQPDEKMRIGINGGFFAQVKLGKIKIQPEILYSQQGFVLPITYRNGNNVQVGNEDEKFKFNYLNVPVLVKFNLGKGFNFHFGPQVGFIINAKCQVGNSNGNGTTSIDLTKNINTDFSCSLGFGYEFLRGIILDGRYNVGLNNTGTFIFNGNNRVIQISLGYKLFKL